MMRVEIIALEEELMVLREGDEMVSKTCLFLYLESLSSFEAPGRYQYFGRPVPSGRAVGLSVVLCALPLGGCRFGLNRILKF